MYDQSDAFNAFTFKLQALNPYIPICSLFLIIPFFIDDYR